VLRSMPSHSIRHGFYWSTRFPVDQSGEYDVSTTSEPLKHQVRKMLYFPSVLTIISYLLINTHEYIYLHCIVKIGLEFNKQPHKIIFMFHVRNKSCSGFL
jgi:hypothetical protein